jgi:hypothetical protein
MNKNKEIIYEIIMKEFFQQFPGLHIDDLRPNGQYQIYVWIKGSPTNIMATYRPESNTFDVETTYREWSFLDGPT